MVAPAPAVQRDADERHPASNDRRARVGPAHARLPLDPGAGIVGSVVSAKIGGNAMVWHFRFGYVVFTLLAFRLLWGLVGGRWSRFASFVYAPARCCATCAGRVAADEHLDVGHNPLGSLSVFALLRLPGAAGGHRPGGRRRDRHRRPAEPLRQRHRRRPGHALAQGLSGSGSCWPGGAARGGHRLLPAAQETQPGAADARRRQAAAARHAGGDRFGVDPSAGPAAGRGVWSGVAWIASLGG